MAHLIVLCPPLPGHINPMVALARELLTRGHRVTFVGFPDMRGKLPDDLAFAAIAERDIPPGSLQPFIDRLALLGGPLSIRRLMLDLARFAELLCRELPAAIERLRPDAMVIDQTDAASSLVATALQVPFVNVANALPLNLEPGVPPPVLPWRYDPSARGIRRNLGGYRVARLVEWPITKVIRRHAGRLGRPDIRFADQAWSDLCQITQCVRGLDFPRSELPANFHYVGPIRGPETALDVDLPDDGRPLVFCSLGTLQGSRAGIFRAVAKAAAQLDVTLLIAHGGMLGQRDIARLPGRPLVHGFVAQQAVLGRCDLAVTHCGLQHRARFARQGRADGRLADHLRTAGDRRAAGAGRRGGRASALALAAAHPQGHGSRARRFFLPGERRQAGRGNRRLRRPRPRRRSYRTGARDRRSAGRRHHGTCGAA